jgi:hypothetical protein
LSTDDEILKTGFADYLIRSKKFGTDEGGISTGYAFIDTVDFV